MTDITLDILPQRAALVPGKPTELHVLVRARAPARPAGQDGNRAPLNLAIVLDRSGSMQGEPLREAKRCASYIIDQLDERDRAAIVAYDSKVDVAVPSSAVTDKAAIHRAIDGINPRGLTALFDGWREGATQVGNSPQQDYVTRVLLLSDGCANVGPAEPAELASHATEMASVGVSTSTYGLGLNFNEHLMSEMAIAGRGQSYYGETAEDLMDPFREEFALMSSLRARHLRLELSAPEGVTIEVLNNYRNPELFCWQLPDLAWEAEAWAVVKLMILDELPDSAGKPNVDILQASLRYEDQVSNSQTEQSYTLNLPYVDVQAWNQLAEDKRVLGRVEEVLVAQFQRQIWAATLRDDWEQVERMLNLAEVAAQGNAWAGESMEIMRNMVKRRDRQRLPKEAYYSSNRMSSRLASLDEDSSSFSLSEESSKRDYLRKKRSQGKRMEP